MPKTQSLYMHARKHLAAHYQPLSAQKGVTLMELMIGLAIGLLITAVALGALMISRTISGSVSDVSALQQQASYTHRVISQQLRQTSSVYLNPDPANNASNDVLSAVAFEIATTNATPVNSFNYQTTLVGDSTSFTTVSRRHRDQVFFGDGGTSSVKATDFLTRNCIGSPANTNTSDRIESIFTFADGNLRCGGNGSNNQPITQNIAQFQVNYLLQSVIAGTGSSIQYRAGSAMPNDASNALWRDVQGVQICFVLYGTEVVQMPAGSSYIDCDGTSIDMTALDSPRRNRIHMLFRNTFQLRSQGLPINPA